MDLNNKSSSDDSTFKECTNTITVIGNDDSFSINTENLNDKSANDTNNNNNQRQMLIGCDAIVYCKSRDEKRSYYTSFDIVKNESS